MRITNKFNLPPAIVQAVQNDPYSPGTIERYREITGDLDSQIDGLISTTALIGPPQIRKLYREHVDEIEEDVSDRIWALLGQAVHTILERSEPSALARALAKVEALIPVTEEEWDEPDAFANLKLTVRDALKAVRAKLPRKDIPELRFFAKVGTIVVSGQLDSRQIEQTDLYDYKITSAWTVLRGPRDEWIKQQNMYRWLAAKNGVTIDRLFVGAILRDWSKKKALNDVNYPQTPAMILILPIWTLEETEAYVQERLKIHNDSEIPDCTPEERWATEEQWAVMKVGRKTAIRVTGLATRDMALAWAANNDHADRSEDGDVVLRSKIFIQERPRTFIRCEGYCPVVDFCPQWKKEQEALGVQPRTDSEPEA